MVLKLGFWSIGGHFARTVLYIVRTHGPETTVWRPSVSISPEPFRFQTIIIMSVLASTVTDPRKAPPTKNYPKCQPRHGRYTRRYIHTYMTCIHIHIHTHIYVHTYICLPVQIQIHIHIHIYIYRAKQNTRARPPWTTNCVPPAPQKKADLTRHTRARPRGKEFWPRPLVAVVSKQKLLPAGLKLNRDC